MRDGVVVTSAPPGRRVARRAGAPTTSYRAQPRGESGWQTAVHCGAVLLWVVAWAAGTAAATTAVVAVPEVPDWTARAGAALLTVVFAVGLTHRCGGRLWLWVSIAAAFAALGWRLESDWARSAAAVLVAILAAVLAVMATRPAPGTLTVLREYALALVLAATGAVAVAGYDAGVVSKRFNLLVLGLSLLAAIGLVWQLGAGLHGLGRRGLALILGGAVLVTGVLIYSTILREYGSASLVSSVDSLAVAIRERIGGVPRPVEVLIGFPALIWGIATRASRRQGWWMCAFGVLGTATVTTSLAAQHVDPEYALWSTMYSALLGGVLGLLLRRVDVAFTGRGRRANRDQVDAFVRPEPARTRSLH